MRWLVLAFVLSLAAGAALAAPRIPSSDDEVVESLPYVAGWSSNERLLRRELAQRPRDAGVAIRAATAYLDLARSQGDARYAGYAMGALRAWEPLSADSTPPQVLVMHATVAQFLHDFDGAEATLKMALTRQPRDPQAWITLATIQRVLGRFADSDASCRSLGQIGPALYAQACLAENAALRGEHDAARGAFGTLLASPALQGPRQADTRQWLLTSLAEVEELAGRPSEAGKAYRQALATERSGYLLLAYSDFLLQQGRAAEVPALLADEPRSDAVLLRLAVARRDDMSHPDAKELKARFEAAAMRPGAAAVHAREHAMFALDVERDPVRALELARTNVRLQREPVDLLLFARAAVAAKDAKAEEEVRALMKQIGMRDARIDAVL